MVRGYSMSLRFIFMSLMVVIFSQSAYATTYIGHRIVGPVSVDLSITTDGKVGSLDALDILDYTVKLSAGPNSIFLYGPLSGSDSTLAVIGNALQASASKLFFDYDTRDVLLFRQNVRPCLPGEFCISFPATYCVQCASSYAFFAPRELVDNFPGAQFGGQIDQSGRQLIATAAVPEPASWCLWLIGFALSGSHLRKRYSIV